MSDQDPILITDARRSYDEELRIRKRRYGIMMGMRIPCLVLAALVYRTPWLAATLVLLSVPLPWMAVIIANDRLPTKTTPFRRHHKPTPAALPPGESGQQPEHHRIIDPPDEP